LEWIVPRYFPEGVTLFAGKPKTGKSWLMLGVALASSRNKVVLDQTCETRHVLYCALEDTERRLQSRGKIILHDEPEWPANLLYTRELKPLDNGGLEFLQQAIQRYPLGLIIIDTLAAVRGPKRNNETEYQADYRTMGLLLDFAKKTGVSVIVVHHVRKQTAEDIFDTISGTLGLSGAADTLVILTRHQDDLRLIVRGRDVEPEDKIVDFDAETGIWNVTGDYEGQAEHSDTKRRIRDLLETAPMSMKPLDIAKALNLSRSAVRMALSRMQHDGQVKRTGYGTYHYA
jgi:RecA-family ATPase